MDPSTLSLLIKNLAGLSQALGNVSQGLSELNASVKQLAGALATDTQAKLDIAMHGAQLRAAGKLKSALASIAGREYEWGEKHLKEAESDDRANYGLWLGWLLLARLAKVQGRRELLPAGYDIDETFQRAINFAPGDYQFLPNKHATTAFDRLERYAEILVLAIQLDRPTMARSAFQNITSLIASDLYPPGEPEVLFEIDAQAKKIFGDAKDLWPESVITRLREELERRLARKDWYKREPRERIGNYLTVIEALSNLQPPQSGSTLAQLGHQWERMQSSKKRLIPLITRSLLLLVGLGAVLVTFLSLSEDNYLRAILGAGVVVITLLLAAARAVKRRREWDQLYEWQERLLEEICAIARPLVPSRFPLVGEPHKLEDKNPHDPRFFQWLTVVWCALFGLVLFVLYKPPSVRAESQIRDVFKRYDCSGEVKVLRTEGSKGELSLSGLTCKCAGLLVRCDGGVEHSTPFTGKGTAEFLTYSNSMRPQLISWPGVTIYY